MTVMPSIKAKELTIGLEGDLKPHDYPQVA